MTPFILVYLQYQDRAINCTSVTSDHKNIDDKGDEDNHGAQLLAEAIEKASNYDGEDTQYPALQ